MAIPFLNNIDLNNNEIQNVRLQNGGSPPVSSGSGQIYFNTGDTTAKYYSNATDTWVSLVQTDFANGTYVSLTNSGTSIKRVYTVDLSATGTKDATTYLRGDNTWAAVTSIYGWTLQGDTGGPTDIVNTTAVDIAGGTNVTTALVGSTLTINATDNNDNDYLTALSFNTGDGVLTATVQDQSNVTVDLDGRYLTGNQTITLSGDVTGSGTTSIATTIAAGAVDFAMLNPTDVITEAEGIENNDNDITIPTSAAVKAYADSLIVGGLIYQGSYDAATNTPDLTTSPNSILKGWTYTVTVEGTFFGEQLRVGDVLIAEENDPSALTDWTTVQNNIDLASLTQVGIGNVNAGTGIDVAYSAGTATVSLTATAARSGSIAVATSTTYTYPNSITAGATNDVLIQLVDGDTGETVYADVTRLTTTTFSVDYGVTTPTGVIALIQLIG